MTPTWQQICHREQQHRASLIPPQWIIDKESLPSNVNSIPQQHLTPKELQITNSPTLAILENLQTRQWSAYEVTNAFCHRAAIAHQLTNCLSEILFTQALQRAKQLDDHNAISGPLHGLPISIKDEFDIKGTRTTLSLVSRASSPPSATTSPNIQILLNAGCTVIAKTTTPIGAFNIETFSNLWGRTMNPYNTSFSSGGSTGGEAALLALKGSAMGVGSDLGGSIRQPCSMTGLYGLRMSTARTPHWNSQSVVIGGESLKPTNGPMGNDLDTVELYAKLMCDEGWKYDINVINKPWTPFVKNQCFKFGIVMNAGAVALEPPVKRAMDTLRDVLEKNGVNIIEIEGSLIEDIASFASFMVSSGNANLIEQAQASGEPVKELDQWLSFEDLPTSSVWELQRQRTLLINSFWKKWQLLQLDGLIMPVSPHAGFKFGHFKDACYGAFSNVMDFPACVFPLLSCDSEIDVATESSEATNYDATESHGVPVGVQLLGGRLQEEKLISMVRYVDCLWRSS